jgi:beta-N-acetylhexosaminidase
MTADLLGGPMFLRLPFLLMPAAMLLLAAATATAGAPSPLRPSIGYRIGPVLTAGPHPDRQIEVVSRKIGQMLMVGFPGTGPDERGPAGVAGMIADGRIGGVILFADNIRNPSQLRALTAALVRAGGAAPPFIAVDQEGGSIQRLSRRKGFQPLPSARTMGKKPLCEAYALYLRTAEELAAAHINVNFGPVVDLDINPRNPAIGLKARSYDRDPARVVAYAEEFIGAHRAAGVLTAAKHFPGHGSAIRDPHIAIVDIRDTWRSEELAPFAALIAEDRIPMVMVGHLIHPRFSDGDRPTSLSRRAITDVLRGGLGFEGLVVTDDLGMDAIGRRYSPEQAAEMAIRAGADVLIFANLLTEDPAAMDRITATVAGAVASGRIPLRLIEESNLLIRAAREELGRAGAAGGLPPEAPACPEPRAAGPSGAAAPG